MYNFLSTSLTLNLIEFGTENNIFLRKRVLSWRFVELEMVLILIYTFSITLPTSGKVTAVFCAFKMNKNTDMSWIWMFPQNPYTKITWLLNWADECYLLVAMLSLTSTLLSVVRDIPSELEHKSLILAGRRNILYTVSNTLTLK